METVAVLRKRWIAGSITARRFASAITDLESIAIVRYPTLPLMRRAYELRHNVTAYDAAYVALAETLECELLTGDGRLGDAPRPECSIRVLKQHQRCPSGPTTSAKFGGAVTGQVAPAG